MSVVPIRALWGNFRRYAVEPTPCRYYRPPVEPTRGRYTDKASLCQFSSPLDSTDTMSVLLITLAGLYIPPHPEPRANRAEPNLATPLDSPPSGTSDPRRKFIDSRGKRFKVLIQIFVNRSLNVVVSRGNALGNHHFIHLRTHTHDFTSFCWAKHPDLRFCDLGRPSSVVPTLCR
jgi:hypothetical protein